MNQLEFTGERFIPGHGSIQMAYEHLHRYLFAVRAAAGKWVLDVASGSGYGTGLLAKTARRVWAVDIDAPAVFQARHTVRDDNICFLNADGRHLPLRAATMDLVVAFEVIEHVRDQPGMVRELARVLKPGGLLLISTPDKAVYSDARKFVNPFHTREFYRDEFLDLLRTVFPFVRLLHQQVRAGSLITGGDSGARPGEIVTGSIPGANRADTASMYFLACCSSGSVGLPKEDSAYLDPADALLGEWKQREIEAGTEIDRLNQEIGRLGSWGRELDGQLGNLQTLLTIEVKSRDETIRRLQAELEYEITKRDQIIRELQERMEGEISHRDGQIQKLQEEFEKRTKWAQSLEGEVRTRDEQLRRTNAALDDASAHLSRIRHAFLYRVFCRLGLLPK